MFPPSPTADARPGAAALTAADLDRRLAAHRRGVAVVRFLRHLAAPLAAALLIAGGIALALRLRGDEPTPALWALALGTSMTGLIALQRTRRDLPSHRDAAAAVDTALRSGGLLMTLTDRPAAERSPAWLARLEPRRDRWRDARPPLPLGRLAKTLAVPAAFALLAWAAPVESMTGQETAVDRTVAGDRLTGELAQTLAALADAGAADPAALARAGEDLRRLTAEIGEEGPTGSQLEAADALRERMLGAVAAAGATDGATVGRLADTLANGADLLAGSGLLESDAVRDAAAAAGLDDPARLRDLLAAAGENREALAELAAGLTDEQRSALAAAGADLLAGGDPAGLLAALPPDVVAQVRAGADRPGPRPAAGETPPTTPHSPDRGLSVPALSLPLPDGAADAGRLAARTFAPGLSAVSGLAGGLWSARPPAAGAASSPFTPSRPVESSSVATETPAETTAGPAPPSQRLTAGRPVPPRLRGVVRRYFSAQTPPPVAE
ncbi:hypothetical protein [Alienimonas californiensis]|uniref:Uncharacterized protein n=1 Tax=Alienimonas californiensis TaxID=2527989 RepID=A0A517PED0_9PLAN|nr:hypothetical protein [Alienimonas californiensis]QDT17735.1 hypothetical protein CA12_38670 [Alienimonas californiensis]